MYLRGAVLSLLALGIASSPAAASVTVGDATGTPPAPASGTAINDGTGWTAVQVIDGAKSYAAPSAGVVTSVSAVASGSNGAANVLGVVFVRGTRPNYVVAGAQTISFTGDGKYHLWTAPTRFSVQAGDRLATNYFGSNGLAVPLHPGGGATSTSNASAMDVGTVVKVYDSNQYTGTQFVSAVVEPDGDGDGYGDETQDSCPFDPAVHAGACPAVLSGAFGADPSSIRIGEVSTMVAGIKNGTGRTLDGGTAALSIPGGLHVVAASTTGGDCIAASCDLGSLAPGATRKIYLVVRGDAVGSFSVGLTAHAFVGLIPTPDISLSTSVDVAAQPPVVQSAPAPVINLCTVPSLRKLTASEAAADLKEAGCAVGRSTGSKKKDAIVDDQSIPAGVRVVAGTTVAIELKDPPKKKSKKHVKHVKHRS